MMLEHCKTCPMLNACGVCEAALRRPERMRACPQERIRRAVRQRARRKGRAPDG